VKQSSHLHVLVRVAIVSSAYRLGLLVAAREPTCGASHLEGPFRAETTAVSRCIVHPPLFPQTEHLGIRLVRKL